MPPDPDLKKELDEIHALVKDNHQVLRAMRRAQWYGLIGKIIIWALVFILPLYFYQQYLEPIVAKITGSQVTTGFFGLPTSAELQKLLNSIKVGL